MERKDSWLFSSISNTRTIKKYKNKKKLKRNNNKNIF